MLVTLTSSTSGELLMFAEILRSLFNIVGKACSARGVFTTEQLPAAIDSLQRAVAGEKGAGQKKLSSTQNTDADEGQELPDVGLAQRAYPLIELMERTYKEGGYLMWLAAKDF